MKPKHILFTSDLSEESMQPGRIVADFARASGAKLTLLHVIEELLVAPHGAPLAPPLHVGSDEREGKARETLEGMGKELGEGLDVKVDVLRADKVGPAVAQYADGNGVDLVCLSTHGRTGFRHLALGSVAESILRHSSVPVLAFPQKDD